MKLKAVEGGLWGLGGEDALFGLYYSHPENAAEYNASVTFPILNQTAFDDITGGGGGGGGDDDAGLLPGFTAIIGVGGLAAAALLRPREDEE
jgi:hypothetical protein